MSLMSVLTDIFTWWNGATVGTRFALSRGGEFVGEDEFGNRYYRLKNDPEKNAAFGTERRWVVYSGYAEASAIPTGWHGWMHHTVDTPPVDESYAPRSWQKPHRANGTGTAQAYRPKGSALSPERRRPAATGDYEAWTPGA
ncbi:NADH dehydrogenase [Methylopila jiangsuensis]|uniref:NADH dehydrogenase n=1 Tax=Methylopila jiangsuensis TaxID=586230 RepID=A0A9W6JH41_9HYPH|nr:NADH:ubiquinone oxidoreductase subunit NDUFA12 [Methylopila jiangsuensis]MDR6286364.1 NADH:ubiquinone oxidoreductase subunit [Methylopila jiangsuensis]GLK76128.1 NADH dehydrogenase [Methylopila jiangsuensis]